MASTTIRWHRNWVLPFLLIASCSSIEGFVYDKDTRDDCQKITQHEECTTTPDVYFQCPVTCTKRTELIGYAGEVPDPEEELYSLTIQTAKGSILSLEDFYGYVTLYAVVPLLPGMAQYYYEMLEHVNRVYSYTLEILVCR